MSMNTAALTISIIAIVIALVVAWHEFGRGRDRR
jgi:hypothetical protein